MVEDRIRLEYDALCYSTFINVYTLSKNSTDICLYDLDTSNKEHLFVLSVITACWHMLGEKDIAIYLVANEDAIPFYEKIGMKKTNEVMEYSHVEWTGFTVE